MRNVVHSVGIALVGLFVVACSAEGGDAGVRKVSVLVTEERCEPVRVDVAVGERLSFEVRNDAKGDREFEGIEGTSISEVELPAGKSRSIPYTVQQTDRPLKVKCYSPSGPTTIIELVPGRAAGSPTPKAAAGSGAPGY